MKRAFLLSSLFMFLFQIQAQTVTDIEGNVYNTVTIGTQVWMKENLRTTKYNDGTEIPLVADVTAWNNLTTPGYCWYNNDEETNKNIYGTMYNWLAVNTGKLCPTGWHVPSDAEWTTLINYLGGEILAGGKLKESGTSHWQSPNTGATDETGFTALPGGRRNPNGSFYGIGTIGSWWSATDGSTTNAWICYLNYNITRVGRFNDPKASGFSVRCIKDNETTNVDNSIYTGGIVIYPNPAIDKLYINNVKTSDTSIMIYDVRGQLFLSKQIDSNPIDVSMLDKGLYIVKLLDSGNVMPYKFEKN